MELKEGMYCRTPKGIGKIETIERYTNGIQLSLDCGILIDNTGFTDDEIIKQFKCSFNIIDLIEVGDYVNDMKVEKNKYHGLYINDVYCCGTVHYMNFIKDMKKEDIKSIVTHEQMEQMKYEVE